MIPFIYAHGMANDFVEIDNSVLRQVLHSRGISHGTLAKELNVTTKTIQRWLNGSVNRVHTETFKSLEKCLGLVGSELRKTEIDFEVRPVDPSLQILCDQDFYQRVRCNYDWHGYRIILKSYLKREIPTEQRLQAYKQIGAASLYMGEVQSGKYFFEKAYKIAVATRNVEEQVATLIWLGTRTELIGSFQQSLVYFREAEQLLPQMKDCYQQSNYHFLYGRLLHYLERHEEAIANLRKAIYLDLKYNKTRGFSTSVKYFHLIGVYLRTRDFKNGALMIQRSLRNTQRCAWVYGQSYSYFAELVWRVQT
ncbi:MAG: hypothetical protein J7501_09775, partial [Bdellovibrio sp.]|nr:hypothetical protein [Bdellovibrio sp.]